MVSYISLMKKMQTDNIIHLITWATIFEFFKNKIISNNLFN